MNLEPHFRLNKQERSGVFFLVLLLVLLQLGSYVFKRMPTVETTMPFYVDSLQQAHIDSLKQRESAAHEVKLFPFNPNFISDYKGYRLGMTPEEIDRLHAFRAKDAYVNTAKEFQRVTLVSDSLLSVLQPYFKFPKWKKNVPAKVKSPGFAAEVKPVPTTVKDLNTATAEALQTVSGIGEVLSARIVKFRNRLGGFLVDEQLYDVYGLEPQVVSRTLQRFRVLEKPQIEKININTASLEELQKLIYLQFEDAESIINYRNVNKNISSFEELLKIDNFPKDKFDRIVLYLSL